MSQFVLLIYAVSMIFDTYCSELFPRNNDG